MRVGDPAIPKTVRPHVAVDLLVSGYEITGQRSTDNHGLERAAGLDRIGHGSIASTGITGLPGRLRRIVERRVRIERREVRHRENVAVDRRHDDGHAALPFVPGDRLGQRLLGDSLDFRVDGQHDLPAVTRDR